MAWKMTYDVLNRQRLDQLGDRTKAKAYEWYNWCESKQVDILIVQTKRSLEEQKANVAKGSSQTMRSYHLVGQALDFVPIKKTGNATGTAEWGWYDKAPFSDAIKKAKAIGFTWGGDWTSLVDKPHLQWDKIGYGADTFSGKQVREASTISKVVSGCLVKKGNRGKAVTEVQQLLRKHGYDLKVDGIFGSSTEDAVKDFQKTKHLSVDGIVGKATLAELKKVSGKKPKAKATTIKPIGKIKIVNVSNACFVCDKPSQNSKNLDTVKKGSILEISGSVSGWWEVIYKGKRAYVNAKYGKKI
ncbi:peptidoglycan-binding protein [Bacillus sp. Bos-x628]|uniref:peptidoglycan-binding protein n=1 Tax=Bacillus maqinnsis TaxID=3229854 RepID=UPI0033905222